MLILQVTQVSLDTCDWAQTFVGDLEQSGPGQAKRALPRGDGEGAFLTDTSHHVAELSVGLR